jgi:ubiquinone/menaquinone biosynthesis C-methylase UbiE
MVKIATKKAAEAGVHAGFKHGSASNMPFPKESFDFLLCRAAFKNFANPVEALQEMCRVLKPGGRAMIIDLKRDASPQEVTREIDGMGLSWFNRIMTKGAFRLMLIKSAYTRAEFEQMLAQVGFSSVEIEENGMGLQIVMTK